MSTHLCLTGAGANGFNPLSLSPLSFHDAKWPGSLFQDSALTTPATANNDPVGGWIDISGNARHLLQATSGKRALLKTSFEGSDPYVKADGVDDYLRHLGSYITDASEVWMQAYPTRTTFPGPGSYLYPMWGQGTSQFPPCQSEAYNGFGSTAQNRFYAEGGSVTEIDGATYTYPAAVTGGIGYLFSNVASGSSAAVTNTGLHVFSLDPSAGTIYYGPEAIAAIMVLSAAPTGSTRTALRNWWLTRWPG